MKAVCVRSIGRVLSADQTCLLPKPLCMIGLSVEKKFLLAVKSLAASCVGRSGPLLKICFKGTRDRDEMMAEVVRALAVEELL